MTDALNTEGDFAYKYPPFETFLSTDADPPTDDDRNWDLVCVKVTRSAGSALDFAQYQWGLTAPLENRTQPAEFTRMIETRLQDGSPVLFRGDYVFEEHEINPRSESLTAQGQLRSYHFGSTFDGMPHWNPETEVNVKVHEGPIFNPTVDERVLPNRSLKEVSDVIDALIWVDAESVQTTAGQTYHDTTPLKWDLKQAVYTMCWLCNPDEEHIRNPTLTELEVLEDAPEIRNLRLPLGQYLPAYLDALLQPLGYNWFIKLETETVEEVEVTTLVIRCFKRGAGPEKELKLQPVGEMFDPAESNCNQLMIANRIGDSVNEVEVLGDFATYEITIPLFRGWLATHDSLNNSDLDKNEGTDYPAHKGVWRDWVANEGGDYTDTRTEITGPPDFSDVFGTHFPRRRQAAEPLTYLSAATFERHQVLVEYSTDSGTSWAKMSDEEASSVSLLPGQIGIRFTGDKPPTVLQDAGESARVRITCTVRADHRIRGFAPRRTSAVNGRVVRQTIMAEQRFKLRERQSTGAFASVLSGAADERDDTDDIQTYAEKLRNQYETAEIAANFSLPGIHLDYEIGDLITKVAGRELSLNMASPTGDARYPQITSVTWEMTEDGPFTRIAVDRGQSS